VEAENWSERVAVVIRLVIVGWNDNFFQNNLPSSQYPGVCYAIAAAVDIVVVIQYNIRL
jgi:hypothetical protein